MIKPFATNEWFKQLFGFKESVSNVCKYISISKTLDNYTELTSTKNQKTYSSGNLTINNIPSLEKSSSLISKSKSRTNRYGKLNIIHGIGFHSSPQFMHYVDVMKCCSHPHFNGATIQIASNFNCLEFESENQKKEDGVTNYALDYTQGPTASLSCAAAAVYRNYFYKNNEFNLHFDSSHNNGNASQNIFLNDEINLLSKTPLIVKHGKVMIKNKEEVERLKSLNFDWKNLGNYYIGNHTKCEVCLKRSDNFLKDDCFQLCENKKQFVNQVFVSALNFSSNVLPCSFTFDIAQILLFAEYKATILAAIQNSLAFPNEEGSSQCFLTQIGGGVFSNPPQIIAPAIAKNVELIAESGINVNVVCFNNESFDANFPLLENAMRLTGGKVITTRNQ